MIVQVILYMCVCIIFTHTMHKITLLTPEFSYSQKMVFIT